MHGVTCTLAQRMKAAGLKRARVWACACPAADGFGGRRFKTCAGCGPVRGVRVQSTCTGTAVAAASFLSVAEADAENVFMAWGGGRGVWHLLVARA